MGLGIDKAMGCTYEIDLANTLNGYAPSTPRLH